MNARWEIDLSPGKCAASPKGCGTGAKRLVCRLPDWDMNGPTLELAVIDRRPNTGFSPKSRLWHGRVGTNVGASEFTFDRHFLCRYGPTKFSGHLSPSFRRRAGRNTWIYKDATVAKPELGTKRICPETGRKFYDLNKDPIVSPYTGKTYPLSYFEDTKSEVIEEKAEEVEEKANGSRRRRRHGECRGRFSGGCRRRRGYEQGRQPARPRRQHR
jgi:hypothetical protein